MRIGIDWGGTKIEIAVLAHDGSFILRERVTTPKGDYDASLRAVESLVRMAEARIGATATVGIGIPGTISPATGLVKNANSIHLNGRPLQTDLERLLERPLRFQNDANCFALSEATDGAAAGGAVVIGVILGTGCGAGIAINGVAHAGRHGIAGEFGHTPLAPIREMEFPGNACWCGRRGCLETYISGTGFIRDYEARTGLPCAISASDILALDDAASRATYSAYCDRLARGLALLINILDPDAIVLGGGMSNIAGLYRDLPPLLPPYVFSDRTETPIRRAKYGDSSGVRGAAWLW